MDRYYFHIMKKWGLLFSVVVSLGWAAVCWWIPSRQDLSVAMNVSCSQTGALRRLTEEICWEKWWPQARLTSQPYCGPDRHPFIYESYSYRLTGIYPKGIEVAIQQGDFSFDTRIAVIPRQDPDSISLEWQGVLIENSLNPFERIGQYRRAEAIRKGMTGVLASLRDYLGRNENIYGFEIREKPVGQIGGIPPGHRFDKAITGRVTGGEWTISHAIDQLHVFMRDYHFESAAPSFESPVTDRKLEPDTTKWVTIVSSPVL